MKIREASVEGEAKPRPWYDFYLGEKLLIFGHWAQLNGIIRKNLIGLDRGCVYGKSLRAVILPQREIMEVKAKKQYCPID